MLKEYPKFKRGAIWRFHDKLSSSEKKLLEDYITYRKARGVSAERDLLDIKRYILQLRYILQKDLRKINLNEVRQITAIINTSWLKNEVKNGLKIDFKNFLKYAFPDWSVRFADLQDIKQSSKSRNEERINAQTIYTKQDIEKLMKHETKLLWKSFLITQYEAGLRTIECRTLKWDSIKFNIDGDISEIGIYATKTSKARTIFVKEATFYLQKLKEEQENTGMKSIYVFPSKSKKNMPVDKNSVSSWFRNLLKKLSGERAGIIF
ncbi:tyrosine-type recombinase/integrase [archaeon]|nr:tyrosine-type recombinase/integrase [archaeon]